MFLIVLRAAALVFGALNLGPSFAHLLEAPPRLKAWPPDLWRETTVFHGQYKLFGVVGGPIELLGVVLTAAVAAVAFRQRDGAASAAVAAILYALALVVWLLVVNRANGVMATWRPGPLPADFAAVRRQWETGHMIMAGLKLAGFAALAWHVARRAG